MTGKQALRANGDDGETGPIDELDQVTRILESSDANELLELVNAGVGKYDEQTLYQQEESYRKGLIAHTGFSSLLTKRAIDQAKRWLARNGIAFYDENVQSMDGVDPVKQYPPIDKADEYVEGERQSTWNAEREYGEEIWRKLGRPDQSITEKQVAAVVKATGLEPAQWIPLFWDMFVGKHEMSRSLDAELIRLYLGEMYTVDDKTEEEGTTNTILRGRRR